MAYQAFILLPADSDATIERARRKLEIYFADDEDRDIFFETAENRLTMTIDDWNLYVDLNSKPYVIEESKDLARIFAAERADQDEIAACSIRLEISADEDEDMYYFNDYLEAAETLGEFKGAKIWEGAEEAFLG